MPRPEPGPVLRLPLPRRVRAEDVARALGAADLVWSDREAAPTDRVSFVGAAERVLRFDQAADPERVLGALEPEAAASSRLGWWGWFGYELGAAWIGVPSEPGAAPAAAFLHAAVGVELDHDAGAAVVVALPGREAEAAALHAAVLAAKPEPPVPPVPPVPTDWSWRHGPEAYPAVVEACREAIRAGDAYQLCLTDTATIRFAAPPDPVAVFRALRAAATVPAALLVRIDGWSLASVSPETFLAVDAAGRARSRPIKGTRRRDADPERDRALAAELLASDKERAENTMIVDLVRNDLARVARVGGVRVTGLLEVETYPAVHQLVSTVEADLVGRPLDAVAALLPAGSMTGTPKRSAVTILRDLERGPRGVYSGAAGRISADGTIDLAVVIRSVVLHGGTATIGAGGGITILSDPAEEEAEVRLKARPLLAACGVVAP
ncbi:anthranilate synthase component I family protein [Amnibacterium endophyticum]|uniref:Anthranilate synthase component I family protein n=1 Tax=Amnibacterium endophyticum TaxID=2109337 RepID=A0ABW4LIB4_9MICO